MKSINFIDIRHIACFVFMVAFLMPAVLCANDKSPLCFTARNGSVTVSFGIMTYVHHSLFDSTHTKIGEFVTITDSIQHHHSIQYSTDSIHWMHYESRQEVTIDDNQSIYFRAESNQVYAYSFSDIAYNICSQFSFASSNGGTVEGSGNIMSLYGPDCPDLPLTYCSFCKMFEGCKLLTKAPSLPATSLSVSCYLEMFKDCISLASAPSLPATKLIASCYYGMFEGCTSLTKAPNLPATKLAEHCYREMFKGCTSLTKVPNLPATKLAEECYEEMFEGCTSLTKAPNLPATKLDSYCYYGMFKGCTSLTKAPRLPATKLDGYCYRRMFKDCTSLTEVPRLPATKLAVNCYREMFEGCTSLVINTTGPGKKWIIRAKAEEDDYAIKDMFKGTAGTMNGTPKTKTTYYIFSNDKGKRNH